MNLNSCISDSTAGDKKSGHELPPSFDYEYYLKQNNLPGLSHTEAYDHFLKIGTSQGLPGAAISLHSEFINYLHCLPATTILEIGPGAHPKFVGNDVHYYDVSNTRELQLWAMTLNDNPEGVPEHIHYVSKNNSYSMIKTKYDMVYSSHNIEHQDDLIQHLLNVEGILTASGLFCLTIPDKRYCFNHFNDLSRIEEIICFHKIYKTNPDYIHCLKILRHGRSTHNDPLRHWQGDHGDGSLTAETLRTQIDDFQYERGVFSNYHNWFFTPESFFQSISLLHELNFITLKPLRVYNTPYGSNSFNAILGF